MSIVAENAGRSPCELPLSTDQWITAHASISQHSSNSTSSSSSSSNTQTTTTAPLNNNNSEQQQHQQLPMLSIQNQQPKIMNAVVPAVACPPAAKKIRRKPENKPQSQINKCNNEKRRRELENEYIEQLGEFLQINKRDMTACKPDKAAILSEVVKKFRNLIEQRSRESSSLTPTLRCTKCPPECSDTCTVHPVQQGDVSSTEPPLPEPSVNGHSPEKSAYFEAVQHYISNVGWALLEINSEGVIEYATENVTDVLHYSRNELHGQSIYSYLHTGDHSKVSPILDKNSFMLEWDQDDGPTFPQTPKRTVRIRWLLKSPDSANETIEQKQQHENKYKDLIIISAPVKDDSDESSSVLCLITLPEEDQQASEPIMPPQSEQLTIRIDANGKILNFDTTTLRDKFTSFITKEIGHQIIDLCHYQDKHRLQVHFKEVIQNPTDAQTTTYRLKLSPPDVYVPVKVHSRMFPSVVQNEPDFIMAIHTILTEHDTSSLESPALHSVNMMSILQPQTSQSMSLTHHNLKMHHNSNMGGPLMTSVINGGLSTISPRNGQNSSATNNLLNDNGSSTSLLHASANSDSFFPESFDFMDFPTSTFDMENPMFIEARPDSRTSITPVSTPRPASATAAYSPAGPQMCPSPLTPYHGPNSAGQPSPSNITNNNNNSNMANNNLTNSNGSGSNFNNNFNFPFDDKEKLQEQIQQHQLQKQQQEANSGKLRNLLTKTPQASGSGMEVSEQDRNPNQILKNLLKAEDDKANTLAHNKFSPNLNAVGNRIGGLQRPRSANTTENDNHMLLQLLKNEDDESPNSNKMNSELLRQLKKKDDHKEPNNNSSHLDDESLMRRLMIQSNCTITANGRKRTSDESDDSGIGIKQRPTDQKVPSKLQEKNKMLASLLAEPTKPPTVPIMSNNLPIRIIPDIPQQQHNRIQAAAQQAQQQSLQINNNNNTIFKNSALKNSMKQIRHQQQPLRNSNTNNSNSKPSDSIYLNHLQQQQQQQQQQQHPNSQTMFPNQQQAQQILQQRNVNNLLTTSTTSAAQQSQSVPSQQTNDNANNLQNYRIEPSNNIQQFILSTSSSSVTTTAPTSSTQAMQSQVTSEWDSELNDILEKVIDFVPEVQYGNSELNLLGAIENSSTSNASQSKQQEEINKIQQSLMQCEDEAFGSNSPPAYPLHGLTTQQSQMAQQRRQPPGFSQPPPVYSQRNIRLPLHQQTAMNNIIPNSSAASVSPVTNNQQQNNKQQQLNMMREMQLQNLQDQMFQQQQKKRLLQQQQNQQMVVPVNATAGADQLCLTSPGIQNIDSLLNNSVAPNVSLTRSGIVVPDSQLSPNFTQNLIQQQLSPNQRVGGPFSPQPNQNFQQTPFSTNNGQRLSPQQLNQQMLANFQNTNGNGSNPQLSPRQPAFGQQQQNQQQTATQQWTQQQNSNVRLSLQQASPMLNAQLSNVAAGYTNQRQFAPTQRQRSLNSPGTPIARQNSFNGQDGFGNPTSPSQGPYSNNIFNNQQMRMQRQQSVPQATQHLPGSPRSYGPPNDGTSGYGMMYNQMSHQTNSAGGSPGDFYGRTQTGGNNNGMNSSQLVRQELRAVVSGRTQQNTNVGGSNNTSANSGIRTPQSPLGLGQGPMVGGSTNGNNQQNNNLMMTQQQPGTPILSTPPDLDPTIRQFNFDMGQGTTILETKITAPWSTVGDTNSSRISTEVRTGDPKNSSLLLQKLLSD